MRGKDIWYYFLVPTKSPTCISIASPKSFTLILKACINSIRITKDEMILDDATYIISTIFISRIIAA